mgnify:CR=1 FL=1
MLRALITGINGQDGSYLAEILLQKGYEVHGTVRRHSFSGPNIKKIEHIRSRISLHHLELTDHTNIHQLIASLLPDEVYNMAAQTFVAASFEQPIYTTHVNALAPVAILDAIRGIQDEKKKIIKFYQASTSEMFGKALSSPQNELTPFNPVSPYAIAKLFAHNSTVNYRESYGLFACSGILFNHESERRGDDFVTQKIVKGIQNVLDGKIDHIELGNLSSKRDWGLAKDYMMAAWLMMQQDKSDTFVISTGKQHSVRDFTEKVCAKHTLTIDWRGNHEAEVGYCNELGKAIILVNPKYFRPVDVVDLVGDSTKATQILGWKPTENSLDCVIQNMVAPLR